MNDLSGLDGLHRYPLARRGAIMSGLITGFTLATTRVEAQAIRTDETGIETGEVKIPSGDTQMPAYFARPATGTSFPVVLVFEEIFGVHEYIKDTCRRLAKAGYMAVATEYYARLGDLSKMTDVPTIIRDVISKAPDAQYMADADATVAWAAANKGDTGKLGVTGFCRGGRMTWLYAQHSPKVRAAVSWYGPVLGATSAVQPTTATDGADRLRAPLLGLYGARDAGISVETVQSAAARAKAAGKTVEIVVFPEAPHGFHADYRPSYRKEIAEDGWARMLAWFKRYGVAPA